jgi:hypothetical protein
MKKGLAVLASVVVLAGGAALLNLREVAPVKDVKVKILLGDCPEKSEDCNAGMVQREKHCVCYTNKDTVTGELKPGDIAAKDQVKVVLCCNLEDPETKVKSHVVTRVKGLTPVPIGCQVLKSNIVADLSSKNVWTEIDDVAKAACCVDCSEDCWIKPGHHGACPYCLCDGTCGKYCPEAE